MDLRIQKQYDQSPSPRYRVVPQHAEKTQQYKAAAEYKFGNIDEGFLGPGLLACGLVGRQRDLVYWMHIRLRLLHI